MLRAKEIVPRAIWGMRALGLSALIYDIYIYIYIYIYIRLVSLFLFFAFSIGLPLYSLGQRFPTCAPRSPKGSACTSQGLRGRSRKIK